MTGIIDTHVYWGEWPFSNTGFWNADRLKERLKQAGISRAFVSAFGHCLCRDEFYTDEKFLSDIADNDFFLPVAGVNLKEECWPERLSRVLAGNRFSGIILHPATRHFRLDDHTLITNFFRLMHESALPVFISAGIEEDRLRPRALAARIVEKNEIISFAEKADQPVIILGLTADVIGEIIREGGLRGSTVLFDTANMDVGPLERWQNITENAGNYCFGSFCPVLSPEAARQTLNLSCDDATLAGIYRDNIKTLTGI